MITTCPVTPVDWKPLRPAAGDNICTTLLKFCKGTILYWRWKNWAWSAGQISAAWRAEICDADKRKLAPAEVIPT